MSENLILAVSFATSFLLLLWGASLSQMLIYIGLPAIMWAVFAAFALAAHAISAETHRLFTYVHARL